MEKRRINFLTSENMDRELTDIAARKGTNKTACLNEALMNYISQTHIENDGGLILPIFNPQDKAEATKENAMVVFTTLCELRRLDLDKIFSTGGAFKQIEKFLYNRLVAENAEDGIFRF